MTQQRQDICMHTKDQVYILFYKIYGSGTKLIPLILTNYVEWYNNNNNPFFA